MDKEIRLSVRGGPRRPLAALLMIALTATLTACGVSPEKVTVPVVEKVDLQRFMGPCLAQFLEHALEMAYMCGFVAPTGTLPPELF